MKAPEMMPAAGAGLQNDNTPPTLNVTEELSAVSEAALKGMEAEAAAPTQAPPEVKEAVTAAVEAAVWNNDKRVNALYTTHHPRNSWMNIVGMTWKHLATTNDSASEAMTLLAAHCREKNCRIDFLEENGTVKEIYVW